MKLINQKVEYIPQQEGIEGIYKQIELAGRTSYKSEDKITENSAKSFVDRMIKSNHGAVLEHGTVYLSIPISEWDSIESFNLTYGNNNYTFVDYSDVDWFNWEGMVYITTNYRVLVENGWLDDLKFLSSPTEFHEKRYTFKLTTSRGISHELVRHRVFSFTQESQRYCNYTKNKFGKEITFIKPSWWNNVDDSDLFLKCIKDIENSYRVMLLEGLQPQQAREILPNCTKTEIVMTGFKYNWDYFFDLRLYGTTGTPHPEMLILSKLINEKFKTL